MRFYRVRKEAYDYFTGHTAIENELVTQKEKDTKFRHLSDSVFEEVEVSKKNLLNFYQSIHPFSLF